MKLDPISWNMISQKHIASTIICRGFFSTMKELSKIKNPEAGNFAICFETQTTYKFNGEEWIDEWYLYMPTWPRGKNGETPIWIDMVELVDGELLISFSDWKKENLGYIKWQDANKINVVDIVSELLNNEEFIRKTKWKDGMGKDWVAPTIQDVIKWLLSNAEFLSKTKWKDGEDGHTPIIDVDYITNLLKQDIGFIGQVKWEPWKPWKDAVVDIKSLSFDLKHDKEFIELTRWEDGIGKDGKSISLVEIIEWLKNDKKFLDMASWKDWEDCKATASDIASELKKDVKFQESIKWKDGVGYPWNPWKDGESITVWFSPDGIKDITADFKEWDKYMYVRVGLRKPNIFQIVK